ncbi:MAG: DUF3179 domain-containing protein [Alphaproteobacteria bacterium]|nr:MAG: DUF3179 domain-containing protein [Alphaproteobacteria bacterium]
MAAVRRVPVWPLPVWPLSVRPLGRAVAGGQLLLRLLILGIALLGTAAAPCPARAESPPADWLREWPNTDFTRAAVPFSEIISGGPPKDGIPAITAPEFLRASAETALDPREPVITLELPGAEPRAYPIRYFIWHEIVNDEVAGVPVAVTYCPLCNSAIVFDRRVDGRTLEFGVTGKLRHSDMIMYDRQTESWWQQALGEGIVGHYMGRRLRPLTSWMESWAEFRARNPRGLVMAQPSANRPYGQNPYTRYDSARFPFLYNGEMPPHGIPPLMRVVRVGKRAWTLERLRKEGEIHEAGLVISWHPGQASPLDRNAIAEGRDIGTIRVRDEAGHDVVHDLMFAFAFHAFFPDGEWMLGH